MRKPRSGHLYGWLVVGLATAAYIVSNIDRQLVSVLFAPIEHELGMSDTGFGALQGLAYGLPYAVFCILIAGLSDRFSRSLIVSLALALWSCATLASGLARTPEHLFIARVIVGLGESALLPAIYSLVSEIVPREQLGRAMGVYSLGPFIGSSLAFLLGGAAFHWLGENGRYAVLGIDLHTWQLTFLIAAPPGLILALAFGAIVRDPRSASRSRTAVDRPPFADVVRYLIHRRGIFIPHLLGFTMLAVTLYATLGWAPAYLARVNHLQPGQAGVWLGDLTVVAGCAGALLAGFVTDALVAQGRRAAPFEVGIAAGVAIAGAMIWALTTSDPEASYIAVAVAIFFGSFTLATSVPVIQSVAPPLYRARISAIFLLINMLGQAFGSFFVGLLDDHLFGGPQGIRFSLPALMLLAGCSAAFTLAFGRRPLGAVTTADSAPLTLNGASLRE